MTTHAEAIFKIESWNEETFSEVEGGEKLTRVSVIKSFKGEIEGEGTLEYLMSYRSDGSASFIGLERIVGKLGNRAGSFVLQHNGVFEGGKAKTTWFVLSGSGTGELVGLKGDGGFAAGHQEEYPMILDWDFE